MAESGKETKQRVVLIAMDGSRFADFAFECEYSFIIVYFSARYPYNQCSLLKTETQTSRFRYGPNRMAVLIAT